jgi:endonuclease/exonuclease/phosphatase family metal-dependent hydrolase
MDIRAHLIACIGAGALLSCTTDMSPVTDPAEAEAVAASENETSALAGIPLRYLAINVGNASPQYGCWEYKLCRSSDVADVRAYIAAWQPDVVLLSEVYRAAQLTGTAVGGPILPSGYTGVCGRSVNRHTGAAAVFDAADASHEHECVAWKTSRLGLIPGSERSAYGRNDTYGKSNCGYDFTGFRVRLLLDGVHTITAVAVHPDSGDASCRTEEIARYWSELAQGEHVIIGGDFNSESRAEIQRPASYADNFAAGRHWNLGTHDEPTAFYVLGISYFYDWAFSSFGAACTACGSRYGTASLDSGSVVGGFHGMPRADGGSGMDHRQVLVDLIVAGSGGACAHDPFTTGAALAAGCSACTAAVCAADSYCCSTAWDSTCASEAAARCTACSHATSATGAPLFNGCNACVSTVCAADPRCCNSQWDSACVQRAASVCQ